MKIAIMSNSGNVGKTTIAREVFALNMDNPVLIEIETNNAGNEEFAKYFYDYKKFTAEQVHDFYEALMLNENVIVDVGASNMVAFFDKLSEYGINNVFNKVIIPTTPDVKQQKDTLKTIMMLIELSTSPNTIYVIPNRVKSLINFNKDFKVMINASKDIGFLFSKDYIIKDTSIIRDLENAGKMLIDVINDDTDYIALAKENPSERKKYIELDLVKKAGITFADDLLRVYKAIMQ